MTNVVFPRAKTGADSVSFPVECHGPETPQAMAAWDKYWADRVEAASRETADEAIVRCRDEAENWMPGHGGAARFGHAMSEAIGVFNRHVRDLAGPDADAERGMGLLELIPFADPGCMAAAWKRMSAAFDALERDQFLKAAAEFAKEFADMTWGLRVAETSKQEGQA